MFKVYNKKTKYVIGAILMFLLLTMNIFYIFFVSLLLVLKIHNCWEEKELVNFNADNTCSKFNFYFMHNRQEI